MHVLEISLFTFDVRSAHNRKDIGLRTKRCFVWRMKKHTFVEVGAVLLSFTASAPIAKTNAPNAGPTRLKPL
jgi:hypothetical protein